MTRWTRSPRRGLLLAALVVAAPVVAGCGSSGGDHAPSGTHTAGATIVGGCPAAGALRAARVLARADLDGDGHADTVALTGRRARCADVLVAKVGDHYASLALGRVRLSTAAPVLVQVPGRRGLLVAPRESHPRGGFQLHLYGYADGRLAELRDRQGNPVVPFVATDTGPAPVSADCGPRSIVVEQAVAHRPPGIAFAWDVRRTTYTVSGARVAGQRSVEIADNVLPQQLKSRFPDLVHHVFFRDCAAAAPLAGGS